MPGGLGVLLLADGRLPTGAYAQSAGLEPGLAAGLDPARVADYIQARTRSVGIVEASAAVLALRAARDTPTDLHAIQDALAARTPSEPLRAASVLVGRGLARLAARLWPGHPALVETGRLEPGPLRPVALGVAAAALGLDEVEVARVSLYDDAQTVASAALKLLPVDPTDATRWVLDAAQAIAEVAAEAVTARHPRDLPATAAPLVEQWSLDHSKRTRRIFVA